ncbi:MAG TPA: MSMEG_4193 family putative phosphomutase [Nocardioidaceae bacterium]|nr:MSMEG_4193 family putative phosphomutase [Nocardioidaceae bacterium]
MATVILARHGRTSANTGGILAGRSKGVHLDELGEKQAAAAAVRVAGLPLAAIVSSPLERCRETAAHISKAQATRVPVRTERDAAEVDYGDWTGQPLKELVKEPLWKTVQAHPAGVVFPGGESMARMSARVVSAVRRWDAQIESEHGPEAVWLLSSHGDPIKAILADALGMHLDAFQRIVVDPGSLSVVRYSTLRPFVLTVNSSEGDLSYLKAPPARRTTKRARPRSSDAVVGGGAGPGA